MKQILKKTIASAGSAYCDAMFEETRQMTISFMKRDVQSVSSTVLKGGRLSVLDKGAYSGSSFTRIEDMPKAILAAVRSARALSTFDSTNALYPAPVIKDEVTPHMNVDPRNVSFEEKVAMAQNYFDIVLKTPCIFTSNGAYHESFTRKTFVNTEGAEIVQDIVQCYFSCRIVAQDGKNTESMGFALGYDSDYARLLDREKFVQEQAELTAALLDAAPVSPGVHTVVADPELSGVFIHEAFGHLSESDDTINNDSLKKMLVLGSRLGEPVLNIIDQGDFPNASGTYIYDDEGVRTRKTYLVQNGLLAGRLYSRLSAYQLNGHLTGNYRATDYRFMPLVRMSNIYIENGTTSVENLLNACSDGYLLCGGKGGQTMGDLFTFGAQYGYEIRNGKLGKMVKDINISGNVFDTLGNIKLIGDDFEMNEGGGCGKTRAGLYDMQMLDKSGTGGPSILIKNVIIGG